jgi:uncharacterized protein (TIGR02611 family)
VPNGGSVDVGLGSVERVSESGPAEAAPSVASPVSPVSPSTDASPVSPVSPSTEASPSTEVPKRWRRTRARARLARNRVYALPGGRTIFKVGIAVLGGLIVALGLVLVPLPGPGWAIVFGGLAIWAIEFAWAARLLDWVRGRVRAFTQMMKKLHWTLRAAFSVAVIAGLLSITWLWVKHRYGFETLSQFWEYITTH